MYSASSVFGALPCSRPNFVMIFIDKLKQNIKFLDRFTLYSWLTISKDYENVKIVTLRPRKHTSKFDHTNGN